MDPLAALHLELATLWVTDGDGRLLHCRTEAAEPPPLLVVGGCAGGVAWETSAVLPIGVGDAVARLLTEAPVTVATGWAPARADAILHELAAFADLAEPHGGPSFVVHRSLRAPEGAGLRRSTELDAGWLRGRLPDTDQPLTAPWVVAVVDDRIAAVCETARSAPTAVEAGVWTYAPYRRRGLAAAVTAAWSTLVADRVAFYSTSWDNLASQGVARHLGLQPIGHWWQVSRA